MMMLRFFLLAGLIFHKLVWEVSKRRGGVPHPKQHISSQPWRQPVKYFKALILGFLVYQTLFLDLFPILDQPVALQIIGTGIYLVGLATAVIGRLQLGKNWVDLEDAQLLPGQSLVTRGIYRYVRHPIYTGDILLLVGLELALNSWLVLAVGFVVLIIVRQASAEEALLSRAFPDYQAYCLRTRRFIPFLV